MSEAPERVHVRWGKAGDVRVTYMEERFWPPDNGAEYTRSDLCVTRADLDAAVALALEGALQTITAHSDTARKQLSATYDSDDALGNRVWGAIVSHLDIAHDAIRALIRPHQADALARVRQETWNAAIEAAAKATGLLMEKWAEATYANPEERMQNAAKTYAAGDIADAIRALALPVDGGAKG